VSLTSYELTDDVATLTMSDGKVNALSPEMLVELRAGLDRAREEAAVVILTGSGTTFSAGFDLRTEGERWPEMLAAGARLAEQLLSYPLPTVAACNGNALAMAGFLLLSADHRIGAIGPFRVGLNEVVIGLTVPWFGIEIARHRLSRPYFDRCTVTAPILDPEEAVRAGFLDQLVEPEGLAERARTVAGQLRGLDRTAHAATKLRIRREAIAGVQEGIERIEQRSAEI
jgi:enoyl-CoA hydratase